MDESLKFGITAMNENGEDKFKAFIEIYNSALRLVGAANATGALAAGAAYQAFEKRPEVQSSIKIVIALFFAGVVAFTISQMAMFLLQMYISNYFRRQSAPSDWETTLLAGPDKPTTATDNLRKARYDFIVMSFSGLFSLFLFLFNLGFAGVFLLAL
jgi:phosphate/sulfate permease